MQVGKLKVVTSQSILVYPYSLIYPGFFPTLMGLVVIEILIEDIHGRYSLAVSAMNLVTGASMSHTPHIVG